mmetsp:Transcript_28237/g.53442  ORF Transcript_28237/g.53442 Transcript_28237/m.53442 type:complete len:209 (+) Transcript_28237:68-694(+)
MVIGRRILPLGTHSPTCLEIICIHFLHTLPLGPFLCDLVDLFLQVVKFPNDPRHELVDISLSFEESRHICASWLLQGTRRVHEGPYITKLLANASPSLSALRALPLPNFSVVVRHDALPLKLVHRPASGIFPLEAIPKFSRVSILCAPTSVRLFGGIFSLTLGNCIGAFLTIGDNIFNLCVLSLEVVVRVRAALVTLVLRNCSSLQLA